MKRIKGMKQSKHKWILPFTTALAVFVVNVQCACVCASSIDNNLLLSNPGSQYDTYMGVNYQQHKYTPSGDWRQLFSKNHPGFDVYFGWRFHPMVGLELGYDWTANKPMATVVPINGRLLGAVNTSGAPITLSSKVRFKTGHADLNAFIPFMVSEAIKPDFILSVGVASMKPSVKLSTNTPLTPLTSPFLNQLLSMEGRSTAVFRAGLGVQSLLIENVGIRILCRFENTARLRMRNLDTSAFAARKVFQNGYSVSGGLFFKF